MTSYRQMMKKMRGDISALLLIAFVFQLLMPVVVFAADTETPSDFERQMQQSICRVDIGTSQEGDAPIRQTDGFVCELCVLCTTAALQADDALPEVVLFHALDGRSQPYGQTENARLTPPLFATPVVPRAPPLG